jgi:hypothetical protein
MLGTQIGGGGHVISASPTGAGGQVISLSAHGIAGGQSSAGAGHGISAGMTKPGIQHPASSLPPAQICILSSSPKIGQNIAQSPSIKKIYQLFFEHLNYIVRALVVPRFFPPFCWYFIFFPLGGTTELVGGLTSIICSIYLYHKT